MIQPNRNDLRIRVPGDQFVTTLQTQQCSRAFQLALGEHTNDFALGDFFSSGANRLVRMADIDRDAAERAQKRVQKRLVKILLVDDVADRTRTGELQDECVHPTDMIGHEKKPARRQIFQADRGNAIKTTNQQPPKKIEGAFSAGHQRHRL